MNNTGEEILLSKDIKPTSNRILVLRFLSKSKSAISLSKLEGLFDKADRTTLYRTLKTFEKSKLIHSIEDGTGVTKYALCQEGCECSIDDVHVHFHCNNCEETFCVNQTMVPVVRLPDKFEVSEMNMVVKGICENCKS